MKTRTTPAAVRDERDSTEDAIAAIIGTLATSFLSAWMVMLGLGAAHSLWPVIPPAGYWTVWLILLGIGSLKHVVTRPSWKWARR